MNKAQLAAKLEAVDKELLPLFEKKGKAKGEFRRVAKLEAESEMLTARLGRMRIAERLAASAYGPTWR